MSTRFNPDRLDLRMLAQSGEPLQGDDALALYPRLAAENGDGAPRQVRWVARAEWRRPTAVPGAPALEAPVLWLQLQANTHLLLTCQRCLAPVDEALDTDRWFRFVADEATADNEDEDSEEDVLVFQPAFNLRELIEDELIMAQPLVPMHGSCPTALPMSAGPVIPDAPTKANPFAVLQQIKKGSGGAV